MNRFEPFSAHELLIISEGFDGLDYLDPEQKLTRALYHQVHEELLDEMEKRKMLPIKPKKLP